MIKVKAIRKEIVEPVYVLELNDEAINVILSSLYNDITRTKYSLDTKDYLVRKQVVYNRLAGIRYLDSELGDKQ